MPVRSVSVSVQTCARTERKPFGRPSVNGELANSAVATGCSSSDTRSFAHHVGLGGVVEIDLHRAGAQSSCRGRSVPTLRHVAAHDRVAAFRHPRHLLARAVGWKPSGAKPSPSGRRGRAHLRRNAPRVRPRSSCRSRQDAPDSSSWPAGSSETEAPCIARRFRPIRLPASRIGAQPGRAADALQHGTDAGRLVGRRRRGRRGGSRTSRARCRCANCLRRLAAGRELVGELAAASVIGVASASPGLDIRSRSWQVVCQRVASGSAARLQQRQTGDDRRSRPAGRGGRARPA